MATLAENKKAYYKYKILEKFEAGISLIGQEVKSLKTRGVNLAGSYVVIKTTTHPPPEGPKRKFGRVAGGSESRKRAPAEAFWIGAKISPYQPKNVPSDYIPERSRKLLLKKSEIKYLIGKAKERGLTLIPLRVYTKRGNIKLEFAIAKGLKKVDKRELIRKRETEREIERELKLRG